MLEEKSIDRNQIIGFVLIAAILFGMSFWASELQPDSPEQAAVATVEEVAVEQSVSDAIPVQVTVLDSASPAPEVVVLENDVVKYTFTTAGAQLQNVELKDYKRYNGEDLYLVNGRQSMTGAHEGVFTAILSQGNNGSQALTMTSGATTWTYTLGDGYGLAWALDIEGAANVTLDWKQDGIRNEKSLKNEAQNTSTYFWDAVDESDDYLSDGRDDEETVSNISWVAHKQQYFSSIFATETPFTTAHLLTKTPEVSDTGHTRLFRSELTIAGSNGGVHAKGMWYHGPNKYNTLKGFDQHFDEIIPFGWGIFGWISKGAVIPMFNLFDNFGWNYGFIIFLMALIIKVVLSPLTFSSYKSMAKMRVLKPELDEINERHKDSDAVKKQQEVMALYQKVGVNPLGGCIPQLLQFPILIAMFRFFPASIELRQQSFLWADDLSAYDSVFEFGQWFSIPFYGDHISLFTILMAISTYLYTKFNNSMTPQSGNSMMQQQMVIIQYLMPVMLLVWFNNYASGLSFYYFVSNILIFAQQWAIRKFFIDEEAIHAQLMANKASGKTSKFQKRMNDMMEAQKEAGNRRMRRIYK
ncbi:MAG TPA: membrane protein insertase YidC [Cryomorphaceae bacterium]|mgnify:CR=1 FL=1|nr:membrane protein insertase YidC [Cryomorphaceae bacterium]